jgi:hypothetical protein
MKSVGAFTLLSAARESQVSVNRKRWASTEGPTDAIAALTAATNEFEAPRPTRKPLIALVGGCIKKHVAHGSRKLATSG